jgi:endoglucanase
VYARGYLASPVTLSISSNNGGTLSASTVTLPAGANSSATYTYTTASNRVATLTYSGAAQVPPARKVYSLSDPVSYAATSLSDAALAILGKYSASKWDMADGYTDYMQGAPAAAGQPLRAVSDSGYGSSAGNAMDMLNWINTDTANNGGMLIPKMATAANGKKYMDVSAYNTWGLWCKKSESQPGIQANPKNKVAYQSSDNHFAIACVSVPNTWTSGTVFQASKAEDYFASEIAFANGCPQAKFTDVNGQAVTLTSSTVLPANTPTVLGITSVAGAQRLRVNSVVAGSASATLAPSEFNQMLIGWGFQGYYPRGGFMGGVYSVITGKGAPTTAEMAVLEKYLASTAGVSI